VVVIWKITPTCADMTRLASESQDRQLSLYERARIRLHFLICVWCERYFKQLYFLRDAAKHSPGHLHEVETPGLTDDAKERMKRVLAEAGKE
jgi:hypothetical protein